MPTNRKKLLMHYADWNYTPERRKLNTFGPLGYYRIVKPAEQIKDHDVTIIGSELDTYGVSINRWENVFDEFDIFWTGYFSERWAAMSLLYWRDKLKKKVVIDLDDNYLDIPESNHLYDRFKPGKQDRAMLGTLISLADALTVSTYPLKERLDLHLRSIHNIKKPIFVIPNMNDVNDWRAKKAKLDKKRITIGYSASNSHYDDIMMFAPALRRIMEKYPNVHFQAIGTIEKEKIPQYFNGFNDDCLNRIWLGRAESVFTKYPKLLGSQKWDIGIAPLVDTAFTRSKSHIKWMEYAMFEIPTIASYVYPYFMPIKGRKTITDGKNGILARSHEWFDKLEMLILDKEMRETIGKNAKQYISENWQYSQGNISNTVNEMIDTIHNI